MSNVTVAVPLDTLAVLLTAFVLKHVGLADPGFGANVKTLTGKTITLDGDASATITINSSGTNVTEHIFANARLGEIIYRIVDPQIKSDAYGEGAIRHHWTP